MTDPIKAAEQDLVGQVEARAKELDSGAVKAVEATEAEAKAEDAAIQQAVHNMYLHALQRFEEELAAAEAAELRAAAWLKAKRWVLFGIGLGILVIVIAHRVS